MKIEQSMIRRLGEQYNSWRSNKKSDILTYKQKNRDSEGGRAELFAAAIRSRAGRGGLFIHFFTLSHPFTDLMEQKPFFYLWKSIQHNIVSLFFPFLSQCYTYIHRNNSRDPVFRSRSVFWLHYRSHPSLKLWGWNRADERENEGSSMPCLFV